jgi:hypothetical protein
MWSDLTVTLLHTMKGTKITYSVNLNSVTLKWKEYMMTLIGCSGMSNVHYFTIEISIQEKVKRILNVMCAC